MKFWKTLPFTTAFLVLQAQAPNNSPIASPDLDATLSGQQGAEHPYQVMVVHGSTNAISYRNLKFSTVVDIKGTALHPAASGEATVKSQEGAIHITAKFKNLPPASSFGGEFLTYVLWGVSPEGRATNLGELLVKHGDSEVHVTEQLQTFGLVVTAEPYFAVSQPSDAVILENSARKGAEVQNELIETHYELLKRGQYNPNVGPMPPVVMDEKTPFVLYQARNAVRIAKDAGARTFAPEAFEKAQNYLKQAEEGEGGAKGKVFMAREAVQRAEDARLIAVQRQEARHAAMERKSAQNNVEDAKSEAAMATLAQEVSLKQARRTEAENEGLRSNLDVAKRQTAMADAAQEAAQRQAQRTETENEGLRIRLRDQLNSILQTRATARGLIVNMSGVLFLNGKATLLPAAREKLAKIAGILSTHKGLMIEADGFTDSTGSDDFNQRLSEERASATKDYLVGQGVPAQTISFKGFGKDNPISSNETNAGRQENRRVELVVSGEGITAPKEAGF